MQVLSVKVYDHKLLSVSLHWHNRPSDLIVGSLRQLKDKRYWFAMDVFNMVFCKTNFVYDML